VVSKRFGAGTAATALVLALGATVTASAATAAPGVATGQSAVAAPTGPSEYTVVAADGVPASAAVKAIEAAGGKVLSRTDDVGMFRVVSSSADFTTKVAAADALVGAARKQVIGVSPKNKVDRIEREKADAAAAKAGTNSAPAPGLDPLDDKLWGLKMVRSDLARKKEPGDKRVTVGILDTGLDASNPDLAPNFNRKLSRNFAPDIPDVDGPCEVASCLDPVGTDDGGHGTHVAGTVGAAANRLGVSGVAPNVSLVELKGGQDSGFFFVEPVVKSLVHAGRVGIDVVNMSFFIDPWLYNCFNNPADSAAEQAEQLAIITVVRRALNFAHRNGVTLIAAHGNNHEDTGKPRDDIQSPNFPPPPAGAPHPRPVDNASCFDLPTEGPHVISVNAIGPSTAKADYSNYGTEQSAVAAPGGYFRDGFGTPTHRTNGNLILSTYPLKVLQEEGTVDANGNVVPGNEELVFKQCTAAGKCGYYTYLQGTSMASPHAAGVASLIVSRFGRPQRGKGLTLAPAKVESHLYRTAAEHACPEPRLFSYANVGRPAEFDAFCWGDENFNGFYGNGIVDALAAVTTRLR
jgi:lantibiotic leader peptide-processing serine protease